LCLLAAGLCLAEAKAKAAAAKPDGWKEKTNDEGKVVQELKIEAPSMTEEDQYGYKMPDRYKCDSCRAVMFHLDVALKAASPKSRRMKQWEYTDTFDDACKSSFEGYGIKLLHGENTLSGPGLTHQESLAPGSGAIQMGGETWTKRLNEACRTIIYERVGEDELYDKFREEGGLTEAVCFEAGDCTTGPKTPPKPKKEPPAEKPKEDAKKAEKAKAKKAEKAKEKERKEKAKVQESKAAAKAASGAATEERVDAPAFLRNMAVRHGVRDEEYVSARTEKDWEKLIVAMAGRIFNARSSEL